MNLPDNLRLRTDYSDSSAFTIQPSTSISGTDLLGKKDDGIKNTSNNANTSGEIIARTAKQIIPSIAKGASSALDSISDMPETVANAFAQIDSKKNPSNRDVQLQSRLAQKNYDKAHDTHLLGEKVQDWEKRVDEAQEAIYQDNPDSKLAEYGYKATELAESAGAMLPTIAAAAATAGIGGAIAGVPMSASALATASASQAAKAATIGKVAQGVGLGLMWANVYDKSTQEAYQSGADFNTASKKGFYDATLETATELMFGTIGGFKVPGTVEGQNGLLVRAVNGLAGSKGAEAMIAKGGVKTAGLTVARAAVNFARFAERHEILGEALEEMTSEALSPFIERWTTNPEAPAASLGQIVEAGIGGAILSVAMGGVSKLNQRALAAYEQAQENRITQERINYKLHSVDEQIALMQTLVFDRLEGEDVDIVEQKMNRPIGVDVPRVDGTTARFTPALLSKERVALASDIIESARTIGTQEAVDNAFNRLSELFAEEADALALEATAKAYETETRQQFIEQDENVVKAQEAVTAAEATLDEAKAALSKATEENKAELTKAVNSAGEALKAAVNAYNDAVQKAGKSVDKGMAKADAVATYGQEAVDRWDAFVRMSDIAKDIAKNGTVYTKALNSEGGVYSRSQFIDNYLKENPDASKQKAAAAWNKAKKEYDNYRATVNAELTQYADTLNKGLADNGITNLKVKIDTTGKSKQAQYLNGVITFNPNMIASSLQADYLFSHEFLHYLLDGMPQETRTELYTALRGAMKSIGWNYDIWYRKVLAGRTYNSDWDAEIKRLKMGEEEAKQFKVDRAEEETFARFMQTAFANRNVLECLALYNPELAASMQQSILHSAVGSEPYTPWDFERLKVLQRFDEAIKNPVDAQTNAKALKSVEAKAFDKLEDDDIIGTEGSVNGRQNSGSQSAKQKSIYDEDEPDGGLQYNVEEASRWDPGRDPGKAGSAKKLISGLRKIDDKYLTLNRDSEADRAEAKELVLKAARLGGFTRDARHATYNSTLVELSDPDFLKYPTPIFMATTEEETMVGAGLLYPGADGKSLELVYSPGNKPYDTVIDCEGKHWDDIGWAEKFGLDYNTIDDVAGHIFYELGYTSAIFKRVEEHRDYAPMDEFLVPDARQVRSTEPFMLGPDGSVIPLYIRFGPNSDYYYELSRKGEAQAIFGKLASLEAQGLNFTKEFRTFESAYNYLHKAYPDETNLKMIDHKGGMRWRYQTPDGLIHSISRLDLPNSRPPIYILTMDVDSEYAEHGGAMAFDPLSDDDFEGVSDGDLATYHELQEKYGSHTYAQYNPRTNRMEYETDENGLPKRINENLATNRTVGRIIGDQRTPNSVRGALMQGVLSGVGSMLGVNHLINTDAAAIAYAQDRINRRYDRDAKGNIKKNSDGDLKRVNNKTLSEAYTDAMYTFDGKHNVNKNDLVFGQQLIVDMADRIREIEAGEQKSIESTDTTELFDQLERLITAVCSAGSRAGQNLQAMGLLQKLTPTGRLYYIQSQTNQLISEIVDRRGNSKIGGYRYLRDANGNYIKDENGKMTPITIPQELQDKLLRCTKIEEMQEIEDKEIIPYIASLIPPSIGDRIVAWRYLAMLGNPRTHIRNMVSNFAMGVAVKAKNQVASRMEDYFLKDRTEGRTKTAKAIDPALRKALKDFAVRDWERDSVKDITLTGGKIGFQSKINDARNKLGVKGFNVLDKASKGNSWLLEAEDEKAAKLNYVDAFISYCAANNLTPEYLSANNTVTNTRLAQARSYACTEAAKATYHDASELAAMLNKAESKFGTVGKLIVGGMIPFKKTPINILKRGIEYSPAGIAQGLYQVYKAMNTDYQGEYSALNAEDASDIEKANLRMSAEAKQTLDFANAIDRLASGMTGTMIMLLGLFLAKAGLLKAGGDENKREEYYDQMLGNQEYSVTMFGKNFTLDWLTPVSMPLFTGAELIKLMDDGLSFNEIGDALTRLADPVMNLSVLQGINQAMSSYDSGLGKMALSATESYAGQFIPTLAGQIARSIDPVRRTTYVAKEGESPLGNDLGKFVNRMQNKIPFASSRNSAYVDMWGRQEVNDDPFVMRLIENSVFPWYQKDVNKTDADDKITDIAAKTGNISVIPNSPQSSYTVDGEKYYLMSDEYQNTKELVGQLSYSGVNTLFEVPGFLNLSAEVQADYVTKVYEFAKAMAKYDYLNAKDIPHEEKNTYNKIKQAVMSGMTIGQAVYIYYTADDFTADKNEKGKSITGSKKQKVYDFFQSMGMSKDQMNILAPENYKF